MKRKCSKCEKYKPREAFAKLERGVDGRRAQCKDCDRKYRNKRKRVPMPSEHETYIINETTMMNHFYLHFGFTERRYNPSEGAELRKYEKEPLIINNNNKKR